MVNQRGGNLTCKEKARVSSWSEHVRFVGAVLVQDPADTCMGVLGGTFVHALEALGLRTCPVCMDVSTCQRMHLPIRSR